MFEDQNPIPDPPPAPDPEPAPDPPPPPPLPLPELPPGAILVTFQANIGGYPPTTAVLSPRIVQKMIRRVSDAGQMVNGAWVPQYQGLTDLFMRHIKETLFADLEARYPEADPELSALEAEVEARKAALLNRPVFLED